GTGTITTVAGSGTGGLSGDGGPATAAELMGPSGVALDGAGILFIADTGNARVRRVDAGTGTITTVAGGGTDFPGDGGPATAAAFSPADVTFDGAGNLFIADWYGHRIREVRFCGDGVVDAGEPCDATATSTTTTNTTTTTTVPSCGPAPQAGCQPAAAMKASRLFG